ncbi:MAG: neutral zinc metallopeptidase [Deltaproteobacteria bacterium]|nr:neutral zinc metallopeptidase [Deltaproteobacteria bacterium]
MRWQGRRQSSNVEDRRGLTAKKGIVGGGLGTIIIVLAIYFLGGDPSQVLNTLQVDTSRTSSTYVGTEAENELAQFVSVVLAETEDVWKEIFNQQGLTYEYPKLIIFSDSVQSACGYAASATGPFYCPGDYSVYIDLSFFNELQERFQAPGDFAMAYVIAHEIGHHVQTLLGIMEQMNALRSQLSETDYNKYLIRLELQADYFAGVWAHYAERANILEEGDIEEALKAASAVGDDRIQRSSQGYVVPDSFTHGTSEQRSRWFHKGFRSGTLEDGDTFGAEIL